MTMVTSIDLALFTMTIFSAALFGLSASGHFPAAVRAPDMRSTAGMAVLWLTALATIAACVMGVRFAWARLPLPATVISGGLAVLFAPLALQPLSDRFVDGRGALAVFATISGLFATIAWARMP